MSAVTMMPMTTQMLFTAFISFHCYMGRFSIVRARSVRCARIPPVPFPHAMAAWEAVNARVSLDREKCAAGLILAALRRRPGSHFGRSGGSRQRKYQLAGG